MSKVITFSRVFPAYHPKKGQPTYFIEKIWRSLLDQDKNPMYSDLGEFIYDVGEKLGYAYADDALNATVKAIPKPHTIRAGNRWKAGDLFSPRVWSGKPYYSPQIIIAPDIQVKKTWDFVIDVSGEYLVNGECIPTSKELLPIAINDGFKELDDFELWFKLKKGKSFEGQIICWNDKITY
jgi:hypothetical protein